MCDPPCAPMLSSLFSGGAPIERQKMSSSRELGVPPHVFSNHRSALLRRPPSGSAGVVVHTLTFSASRVTRGRRRAGRRPGHADGAAVPAGRVAAPRAPRGAAARGGTGLSGALKDVTSNIDDCRLFVRAVPYAAGSPRGYLAVYFFKFFNLPRSHRVGSVLGFPLVGLTVPRRSVARCLRPDPPAAIPPPTAPRTDQGQRPERRAQHSA
jgi:hypothetical protein